jgi:hypothetical protein
MEVEDEDALLQRLFFKRFGRALPEPEKEKDDVDGIDMNLIDLTQEDDEMEVAAPVVVVKTEPIEIVNVANVNNVTNESGVANIANADVAKRRSFRLERLELAKARKAITEFGKTLRKTVVIPEKEPENVIADTDTNMSEDTSVNTETVEQTIAASKAAIAASEAAIAASDASQKEFADEFGDTPIDEFDD